MAHLIPIIASLLLLLPAAPDYVSPAKRPLILVHYMPWFEAKPVSDHWGWHWTMNAFHPDHVNDGIRPIASHYHPLIGPYDSSDLAVLEYHLLLMKLAGIDGLIVDWYGLSNLYDYPLIHRNTGLLLDLAAKLGLRVGICYEDQTIPALVEKNVISAHARVQRARADLDWLRKNWFTSPAYLKLDGKPVLLSFGWSGLDESEWEQVLAASASNERPLIYVSEHRRRKVAAGTFDWPQPQSWPASLDRYYESVKGSAVFMPVAFPRFHDIYDEAKVHASYGEIPDDGGRTFTMTLERALNSGAPLVQIATWNDWGEGTQIEPSTEFGYRDLEAIQRLRREHVDSHFAAKPGDLRLPYRLWKLHRAQRRPPSPELDEIARLLASGRISGARSALRRAEAILPEKTTR